MVLKMEKTSSKQVNLVIYSLIAMFLFFLGYNYYQSVISTNSVQLLISFLIICIMTGLIVIGLFYLTKNAKITLNLSIIIILIPLIIQWIIIQITTSLMSFSRNLILSLINGLAFSMVLFLMVSGFYLIFGLADVINFAHGSFFMLGGFIGFASYLFWENFFLQNGLFNSDEFLFSLVSFFLAMIFTTIFMGILGGLIEISTIRKLYKKPLNQILLTVGISFVITQVAQIVWGQVTYFIPSQTATNYFFVTGQMSLGKLSIPFMKITLVDISNLNVLIETYSLVIIIFGLVLAIIMYFTFSRTKTGLLVQAAIEDSEMTEILGTNVKQLLTLVFIAGTILAGLAGFIIVPSVHGGASISNSTLYLLYAFIIVVVGGAHYGKFEGTFFGSLIIGFSYKFTELFFTDYTTVVIFLIMALVLIFKPTGLTGQE